MKKYKIYVAKTEKSFCYQAQITIYLNKTKRQLLENKLKPSKYSRFNETYPTSRVLKINRSSQTWSEFFKNTI